MHPTIFKVPIPNHKPGKEPDHRVVGNKLDTLLKKHFMGRKVVIRCIGSQDHPGISLNKLTNVVAKTGTDKYDSARIGFGYEEFKRKGIKVDFYAEPLEITKATTFMPQQIWEMHHSAIGDRGFGVHVDLVLIYDADQVEMVTNLYGSHSTSDGYVFKNPTNKQAALLGIIKIINGEEYDVEAILGGPAEFNPKHVSRILADLNSGVSLDKNGMMTKLIKSFASPQTLDPYTVICALGTCSAEVARLLGADVGLWEKYRLHEHTQAVLGGFETDYARDFPDPHDLKLIRTTLLLQDIGKSLCVGNGDIPRHKQDIYNLKVASNLLDSVDPAVLNADERAAIMLLIGQDIIGSALKGASTTDLAKVGGITLSDANRLLRELKNACPPMVRARLHKILPIIHLSDLSAYTTYRSYKDATTKQIEQCTKSYDNLFEKDSKTGALRLVDAKQRQIVADLMAVMS